MNATACRCGCGCSTQILAADVPGPICSICAARNGLAVITMNESPSTGYVWRHDELPDGVELVETHYVVADPQRARIGGTGIRVFLLRGPAGGNADIAFQHGRPWQRDPIEVAVVEAHFERHEVAGD